MHESASSLNTLWDRNGTWYGREDALIMGDQRRTYASLVERARCLGSALYKLGVRSQDRVCILSMNSMEYIELYTANEIAGFITSTVNFRLAPPEIGFILRDASPKVIFFESQYAATIDGFRDHLPGVRQFVCLDGDSPSWAVRHEELLASGEPEGAPTPPPEPDSVAALIYTSGTTGRPKGCMLSQDMMLCSAETVGQQLVMSASTRVLLMMPFFHIGAKVVQLAQHRQGGQVFVHRSYDIDRILRDIQKERITHLHFAPVMLQGLIEHPDVRKYDLSSLQSIYYSAAPMAQPVLKQGLDLFGPIFVQGWGQTECSGTVLPPQDHRLSDDPRQFRRLRSLGHPAFGMQMRLVDEEDRDVPIGQPGELVVRGRCVMSGYWNNSAATIEAMRGGWMHTGDVCTQDEDGYLYLADRKKDMIISGGENVYSREVEEAVVSHPAVQECAVIGVAHARWGEAVCAVVQVAPDAHVTAKEIVAHCREKIASYKRPRFVVLVSELPRLPSGKVSKVELRARYGEGVGLQEVA